jgi:hypothetical protein
MRLGEERGDTPSQTAPARDATGSPPKVGGNNRKQAPGFGDSCSCGRFGFAGDNGEDQPRGHRWDGRRCSVVAVAFQKWLEERG